MGAGTFTRIGLKARRLPANSSHCVVDVGQLLPINFLLDFDRVFRKVIRAKSPKKRHMKRHRLCQALVASVTFQTVRGIAACLR